VEERRLAVWESLFRKALHLSPRLNDTVEAMSTHYNEQANFIKLYFPEGEIDIVAAGALTHPSTEMETVLGRQVQVETSAEILAKKIYHRAREFTARDLFDFALIAEKEPASLARISNILRDRRDTLLARISANDATLRLVFAQLDVLAYRRSYD
jgi:predicted nucleotidyltransferase component of viral defense system